MKQITGLLFFLWAGIILVAYYVVQKPSLLNGFSGLADTVWTLFVTTVLLFNAYGIGKRMLRMTRLDSSESTAHLLLSFGIGLGGLGFLGLGVSILQIARAPILITIQAVLAILFLLAKDLKKLSEDFKSIQQELNLSFSQFRALTKLAILLPLVFSFLLTFLPPFEAFDVLLYHLTQPATILQEGGLRAFNNFTFWYPNITENVYLWALAFGSERTAQMIHFAWGILTILLLWHWSTKIWGIEIGRKTLLLLATIPSLPMLASWAYVDMTLSYFGVAAIYTVTSYRLSNARSLLYATAILCGMAMGVKYTSFVIPLTCGLILLFQRPFPNGFRSTVRFSLITLLTSLPWFLRNAFFMDNPFYPFFFGGRDWDGFLATWWADAGSGLGWDPIQLFMLPLNLTLGHRDATFFDGRFGPLFLILLPLTLLILIQRTHREPGEKLSLVSIGLFTGLSFAAWTIGVISSAALWQARYLFPAVMAFAIPTALAWDAAQQFDTSALRVGFLINALIALIIPLSIFDSAVFVLQRNPLAVALGAQSRERYIERVNPSYSALMHIMNELPAGARVYSLFEPRSYGLPRFVQSDPINSNFAHDVYLFHTTDQIINHWKSQHFTHIIVYERGLSLGTASVTSKFSPALQKILQETLSRLRLVAQTPDKAYSLYEIP